MVCKGRKCIYTNEKDITAENICKIIQDAMQTHLKNAREIEYLINYERGQQGILGRKKKIRPDINNRIVENHAHEVVEFKDGYVFGAPVTYVQRAGNDYQGDDEIQDNDEITKLNEMLFEQGKYHKDQELANTFHKCGVAYRCILPKKVVEGVSVFDILNLNPMTTFVIRQNDIYKNIVLACSYSVDDKDNAIYGIYTKENYFELIGNSSGIALSVSKEEKNGIGMIPIVEYKNDYDRMGCFERVLPLLEAINLATSDRINGLAQFIQSLIWFNNIDIDEEQFQALSEQGGIKTKSSDGQEASIKQIDTNLNQTEVQTLIDYLYQQVLQISGIPGREQSTGGNTGQAIMLGGSGWQLAETSAKKEELLFAESEHETLKIISKIIENYNSAYLNNINPSDIEIKFSRNKVSNLLTKTQGLMNQLSAGIHPRIAIANCDLYSDPEQVYKDSLEYLEKWLTSKQYADKENKRNPEEAETEEMQQDESVITTSKNE